MTEANRELGDFLRRARARVDPSRSGLPADGRIRRVPGLRREEVALLARVSTDYYTRLEQGRPIVPSAQVLDALARALDLDDAGRAHLLQLAGPAPQRRRPIAAQRVRPGIHQLVDGMTEPAMVLGRRTDVLAANRLARALLADWDALPARDRNYAQWMFTSAEARERLVDWPEQARAVVENLRLDAGRDPGDAGTAALVAALSAASPEFDGWWRDHGVFQRTFGDKRFRHPLVGDLTLQYESLALPGDPDQVLFVYTAEPGSPSAEALGLLTSWVLAAPGARLGTPPGA